MKMNEIKSSCYEAWKEDILTVYVNVFQRCTFVCDFIVVVETVARVHANGRMLKDIADLFRKVSQ